MYYVCSSCKSRFNSVDKPVWLCRCGKPLSVRYNWEKNQSHFKVNIDEKSLWRYESVLPEYKTRISLGEGFTPLVPISENVYVKNESGTKANDQMSCDFLLCTCTVYMHVPVGVR